MSTFHSDANRKQRGSDGRQLPRAFLGKKKSNVRLLREYCTNGLRWTRDGGGDRPENSSGTRGPAQIIHEPVLRGEPGGEAERDGTCARRRKRGSRKPPEKAPGIHYRGAFPPRPLRAVGYERLLVIHPNFGQIPGPGNFASRIRNARRQSRRGYAGPPATASRRSSRGGALRDEGSRRMRVGAGQCAWHAGRTREQRPDRIRPALIRLAEHAAQSRRPPGDGFPPNPGCQPTPRNRARRSSASKPAEDSVGDHSGEVQTHFSRPPYPTAPIEAGAAKLPCQLRTGSCFARLQG